MPSSIPPIDILSPAWIHDPTAMIDRMHAESPVVYDERVQGWLVGGYREIKALEKEPRLSAQRQGYVSALLPEPLRARMQTLEDWYGGWMVMRDHGDHLRLRRLAAHAFQPRALKQLEARIDVIVLDILENAARAGRIEILSELAYPLPSRVICEMVGIPPQDLPRFTRWVRGMNALLGATLTTVEGIEEVGGLRREMREYFTDLIEERRRHPRPGEILTSLVEARDANDALSRDEVIDLVALIMSGAYETTAHLIANSIYLLLTHPEQWERVCADPTLVSAWVEETLRLEPSVALNTRAVAETFDFQGCLFERGQMVYFLSLVANRDPSHFPDPHRFDVFRGNSGDHVAFGFGAHFCIGAPLARMEATSVLRAVSRHARRLELLEPEGLHRVASMVTRGFTSLAVAMGPRRSRSRMAGPGGREEIGMFDNEIL